MKCTNYHCSPVPTLAFELRQTGWLDPPNAGWICPVCGKEYHQYVEEGSEDECKEDKRWVRMF